MSGGSSRKQTVGYKYFFGLHMGISNGPVDELVEIRVGDRSVWSGSVTSNERVAIRRPELFGGEKGEGGIDGDLDVMMGEPDQPVNGRLASMLGGIVPAFRGQFTVFFDGMISAINPYPKPWKFRFRRVTSGWHGPAWYPEKARIELAGGAIVAMNPAHIIMQCETDRAWGRGRHISGIDTGSFITAADVLHAEGFGLCLLWTRQGSISEFIQMVLDHIGGALFTSRRTGLLTLRLIRDGYNPQDLPLFDYSSGLMSIEDDDTTASDIPPNEVMVTYRDPISNEDRTARAQNLGAIQAAGGRTTETTSYPGLPTFELASRVAHRDLRSRLGVRRFKVSMDRRAHRLEPGGLFRIRASSHGLDDLILRIGQIDYGTTTDSVIRITALTDVFGLPNAVFTEQQPGVWVPPNRTPQPALEQRAIEVSYRALVQELTPAERDALADDVSFVAALGVRPSGLALNYQLMTRTGSMAYADRGPGEWCPTALLQEAVGPGATGITFHSGIDIDLVEVGTAALLGDEHVRIDAIDAAAGTVTIARGCIDTVPADEHAAGTRIWFYEDFSAADPTEYVDETVAVKLLTATSNGQLDEALAPASQVTVNQRHNRPYPPGRLRINGMAYPAAIEGALSLEWAHRDRLLQADVLVDTDSASIGPEPGTEYRLRIYGETDTLLREVVLTATSYTYTAERADSDLSAVVVPAPPPQTLVLSDDYAIPVGGTGYPAAWQPGTALHHHFQLLGHSPAGWIASVGPVYPSPATGAFNGPMPTTLITSADGAAWSAAHRYERPYNAQEKAFWITDTRYYRIAFNGANQSEPAVLLVSSDLTTWSPAAAGGPTIWQYQDGIDNWVWVDGADLCIGEIITDGSDRKFRRWTLSDGGVWTSMDSDPIAALAAGWPWLRGSWTATPVQHGGAFYFLLDCDTAARDNNWLFRTADFITFARVDLPAGIDVTRKRTAQTAVVLNDSLYVRVGITPVPSQPGINFIHMYRRWDAGAWVDTAWPLDPLTTNPLEWFAYGGWCYFLDELGALMRTQDFDDVEPAPAGIPWMPDYQVASGVYWIPPQHGDVGDGWQMLGPWTRWTGNSAPAAPEIALPTVTAITDDDGAWLSINDPAGIETPVSVTGTGYPTGYLRGAEMMLPWPVAGAPQTVGGTTTYTGTVTLQATLKPSGTQPTVLVWWPTDGPSGGRYATWACVVDVAAAEVRIRHPSPNQADTVLAAALAADMPYEVGLTISDIVVVGGNTSGYELSVVVSNAVGEVASATASVSVLHNQVRWQTSDTWSAAVAGGGLLGDVRMVLDKGDEIASRLNAALRIELASVRDGIESHTQHNVLVGRDSTD